MFNKQGGQNRLAQSFKIMKTIYKLNYLQTDIVVTPTEEGESIEEQLRRLTTNKQPIPQDVPPIYTPMEEGVNPDHDIRADRFDAAYEATDKFAASDTAKSAERAQYEPKQDETTEGKED